MCNGTDGVLKHRFTERGIVMAGLPQRTPSGLIFWEALSALQKYIRRSDERNAMRMAAELSERHMAILLNRLRVIAFEDISLADPDVVDRTLQWGAQCWEWHKAKKQSNRMILAAIVMIQARAKKSRIANEFQRVVYSEIENGLKPEIPDFALDQHTSRGRKMGRGIEHFLEDGAWLNNEDATLNTYRDEACRYWREIAEAKDNAVEDESESTTPLFDGVDG